MTDAPAEEPTIDELKAALKAAQDDRHEWKQSYRLLKRILIHYGFDIVEFDTGHPNYLALLGKGYLPPNPVTDALVDGYVTRH